VYAALGSNAPRRKRARRRQAERLGLLAQRLRDPDGLNRDTLAQIEQLTHDEQ